MLTIDRTHEERPRNAIGRRIGRTAIASAALIAIAFCSGTSPAFAASATVGLGTAAPYSVLGGQMVSNTGPTILSGDVGVSPGTAITGFPPGIIGGAPHAADAVAGQAQSDLGIAYDDAAGRATTESVAGDLVGQTLIDGVYTSSGPLALSGTLTFDGQGNPNSVFIIQVASTLITATASQVNAINGAQACHIFWQVGSSATLGTDSSFQGTIMALTSISVTNGATVKGRALARNGAVTLENNVFTDPSCAPVVPAATSTKLDVPDHATTGSPVRLDATVTSPAGSVTGTVVFTDNGKTIGTAAVNPATGHAVLVLKAGSALPTGSIVAHYSGAPDRSASSSTGTRFTVRTVAVPTPVVSQPVLTPPSATQPVPTAGQPLMPPAVTRTSQLAATGGSYGAAGFGLALLLAGGALSYLARSTRGRTGRHATSAARTG